MFLNWHHESIRLTGRWTRMEESINNCHPFLKHDNSYTTTTAAGSYLEMAFEGRMAALHFHMGYRNIQPAPHLWVEVDGLTRIEVPVDRLIRVDAGSDGAHVIKVTYKSAMEMLHRWYEPLQGAVSFLGADVEAPGVLAPDDRTIIEFVGDSITEGVLTDATYPADKDFVEEQYLRPGDDDSTATYAALTAKQLNLRPMFQGYGAVGVTRSGCGAVPRASLIYPYTVDGVPFTGEIPDVVVINHGANDRGNTAELYGQRYMELLDAIRLRAPKALVVCVSAFCGAFDRELEGIVAQFNRTRQDQVHYVSSRGWVPEEPLHPRRDGHQIITAHLAPILAQLMDEAGIAHG